MTGKWKFGYAAFGLNFEFCFGGMHCDEMFILFGRLPLGGNFEINVRVA